MTITLQPIGSVHNGRRELLDDDWGGMVSVTGLDAVDGTPELDVEPVLAEFLPREPVRQPAWSHELMAGYWRDPGKAGS